MANQVQNVLYIKTQTNKELKDFLTAIKSNKEVIDFNSIVPMPISIKNTEEGSKSNNALGYYLTLQNQLDKVKEFCPFFNMEQCLQQYNKDELLQIGETLYNNFCNYNAFTWYDWSHKNWGTKWNAYHTELSETTDTSASIYFTTNYTSVEKLISKLVELYPNIEFTYKSASDEIACGCVLGEMIDDDFIISYLTPQSNDALELYAEVWGLDIELFYLDDNEEWHYSDWEEEEIDEDLDDELEEIE